MDPIALLTLARAAMPSAAAGALADLSFTLPQLAPLSSIARAAGFFANIGHESSDLRVLEENLVYTSPSRLRDVWPSRFRSKSDAELARYVRNPKALASEVYANRMGNGGPETGDGWTYRGRGPLQLTGKANYVEMGDRLHLPLATQPDRAAQVGAGLRIAAEFFTKGRIWELCDARDWRGVTKRVNGGYHGHDDRVRRISMALGVANEGVPEQDRRPVAELEADDVPPTLRKGARGGQVAELQTLLGVAPTGSFDAATRLAVTMFQSARGLSVDGVVGPATWRALRALA